MFVTIHTLDSLPWNGSNLDDDGQPKTGWFGGTLRARLSSQSLKRARRLHMRNEGAPSSVRTRLVRGRLTEMLALRGRDAEEASLIVRAGLGAIGLAMNKDHPERTEYLLFLGDDELERIAEALHAAEVWDELLAVLHAAEVAESKKQKAVAPDTRLTRAALLEVFGEGSQAVDLALFGRMVADRDDIDVDAAVQVAHSMGVHHHEAEEDPWVAVDDLAPDAGAGMMESSYFAASVLYGSTTVDIHKLVRNLGNAERAKRALAEYMWATVLAAPMGRKNSWSAYTPPSLILATVSTRQPFSLANAFLQAVQPAQNRSLVEVGTDALDAYLLWCNQTYGPLGEQLTVVAGQSLPQAGISKVTVPQLVELGGDAAFPAL